MVPPHGARIVWCHSVNDVSCQILRRCLCNSTLSNTNKLLGCHFFRPLSFGLFGLPASLDYCRRFSSVALNTLGDHRKPRGVIVLELAHLRVVLLNTCTLDVLDNRSSGLFLDHVTVVSADLCKLSLMETVDMISMNQLDELAVDVLNRPAIYLHGI